jgi:hypothetical protein
MAPFRNFSVRLQYNDAFHTITIVTELLNLYDSSVTLWFVCRTPHFYVR